MESLQNALPRKPGIDLDSATEKSPGASCILGRHIRVLYSERKRLMSRLHPALILRAAMPFILAVTAISAIAQAPNNEKPELERPAKKIAIVVGVSGYLTPSKADRAGMGSLRFAHKDAERVEQSLYQMGWDVKRIVSPPGATMTEATRDGILAAIAGLQTESVDSILFYFSGHGAQINGVHYLAPASTEFRQTGNGWELDPTTLLAFDDLAKAFGNQAARKRIIIVDACRDEPKVEKSGTTPGGGDALEKLGRVVRASKFGQVSWTAMYSCSDGEKSYEDPNAYGTSNGGGVYTQAFIKALGNANSARGDGSIVPSLVNESLGEQIAQWNQRFPDKPMTPIITSQVVSMLPLAFGTSSATRQGISDREVQTWVEDAYAAYKNSDFRRAITLFDLAARQGNAEAMNGLGFMFMNGTGVERNYTAAMEWFEKSATLGNSRAMNRIAILYMDGLGRPINREEAVKWLRKAADLGSVHATSNMGWVHEMGYGVPRNYEEAMKWYVKAVEMGHADACLNVGLMYELGLGVLKDPQKAIDWYVKGAEGGSSECYNQIGRLFRDGTLIKQDYAKAMTYFLEAAKSNNTRAMVNIGRMYINGQGVEKNEAQGLQWYLEAAKFGDGFAMYLVGFSCENGIGTAKDLVLARAWHLRGAEAGEPAAMASLGWLYETGQGGEVDMKQAVRMYEMGAERGNTRSMNYLAMCHQKGNGVEKNLDQAIRWFQKSAELGSHYAMYSIGFYYEQGWSVSQNYILAREWYDKAIKAGSAPAHVSQALLYQQGLGGEASLKTAFELMSKAAEMGDIDGIFNVGFYYEKGWYVQQDFKEAAKWYLKAIERGDKRSEAAYERVKDKSPLLAARS